MKKYILTPIVLLILVNSAFASDLTDYQTHGAKSPKWTPLVEAGLKAHESGNADAAVSFYEKAIDRGCKDGLLFYKLGVYHEEKDDLVNAHKYYSLARKHLPGRYRSRTATKNIHEDIGRVLFAMGKLTAAKPELEKAVSTNGENFTLMFLLGSIARQGGSDGGVINYYSKALTYPPPQGTDPAQITLTILVELGTAFYNLKQMENSLEMWNKILSIAPNHPIARKYKDNIQRMISGEQMKREEKRILDKIHNMTQ